MKKIKAYVCYDARGMIGAWRMVDSLNHKIKSAKTLSNRYGVSIYPCIILISDKSYKKLINGQTNTSTKKQTKRK